MNSSACLRWNKIKVNGTKILAKPDDFVTSLTGGCAIGDLKD